MFLGVLFIDFDFLFFFFFFDQICSKREFSVEKGKIAFVRASMVVTHYIKVFRTGTDKPNGILVSLLLLVAETIRIGGQKKNHIKISEMFKINW